MTEQTKPTGLTGLRVLALESRRAGEMAKLIAAYGGKGTVAPSMREVPLESNTEAIAFARTLAASGFDMMIFLTGVGTRALARVVQTIYPIEQFAEALRRIPIVARGPKPVAALKELGVPVTLAVPEPNTWRDLLRALDEKRDSLPLSGRRVAVQEYGVSNPDSSPASPNAARKSRASPSINGRCPRIPARCARRSTQSSTANSTSPSSPHPFRSSICFRSRAR